MKVFIDSNVILARTPRLFIYALSRARKLYIEYTRSIYDEVMHVAQRKNMQADIAAALVELELIGTKIEPLSQWDVWLKDVNDIHVLEGFLSAEADLLLTENLRDFPKSALNGKKAMNVDELLALNFLEFEAEIQAVISQENFSKNQLKRARLFRLSKLINWS